MSSSADTSRKRQRPSWKDLPAFLDASASVSAATFGARRLPEIKSLWQAQACQQSTSPLPPSHEYQSGGGKTSSRHLRRRTTSYQTRKRHRYPQGTQTSDKNATKKPSRRARRKPALLRQQHETWQLSKSNVAPPRRSVHWLTTHLWHAKRFHVHQNFFGWNVPLVHANRGARSALRLVAEHNTLLQDVTWRMQPILIGSSDLRTLIGSLVHICPNFLNTESRNAVLSGSCFGEGMLHEPNRFPMGAIGPAMWWMCRRPLDSSVIAIKDETWWAHIFVHPAIRTDVHDTLTSLAKNTPLLEGPRDLNGGLACFQLRGRNATSTITRALGPVASSTDTECDTNCECVWDKMSTVDTLHTKLPHLTAVSVRVSLKGMLHPYASGSETADDDGESYLDVYKASIQQWDAVENPGRSPRIGERRVIIVSHCRGDPSISQNSGVCGWDFLCHPLDAHGIFHALTEEGKACTIGLVEEAHVQMESEPPLPVFPRDYPDTVAGQSYWDSNESHWSLLRECLKQGWGRVPVVQLGVRRTHESSVSKPFWNRITTLPENAEFGSTATGPVVVRGEFGMPFLAALAGCGHIPSNAAQEAGERKRRRPRRRIRPPSTSVPLHMLSNEEADAHHDRCETLLRSLSLPALICCHVKVEGKGTITACGRIHASMDDAEAETGYFDFLLGATVAGSFSPGRGCVHGVGFVGAARLLHVLGSHHGRCSCVAVIQTNGARRAELKVTLKTCSAETGGRDATISLLL